MAALLVVAIGHAMSPPRPCRARLRLHAQTVSQAGSMLPEFPASPLPCEKIHPFYLSPYLRRRPLGSIHLTDALDDIGHFRGILIPVFLEVRRVQILDRAARHVEH